MPPTVVDDQVVDLPPKVTVGFERSIKVRDYETAKASVFIQADVPNDADDTAIAVGIRDAFFQAKSIVFDELGIEFSTDEGSVVREAIERVLGPTTEIKGGRGSAVAGGGRSAAQSGDGQVVQGAGGPAADTPSAPTPQSDTGAKAKPIVRDEACPKCGHADRKFWDNRADKASGAVKANYPDYKCAERSCRAGVWLTPKGS